MNTSLSIHWLLNSPLSCYNIDAQKAGPLKRRWPCDIRSVKDRPATRQSYTRTVFYYFQKTTLLYKRNKHSSSWAGVLLKYWSYKDRLIKLRRTPTKQAATPMYLQKITFLLPWLKAVIIAFAIISDPIILRTEAAEAFLTNQLLNTIITTAVKAQTKLFTSFLIFTLLSHHNNFHLLQT